MLFFKSSIFIVSLILVTSDAGFLDTLPKCKINDGDCQRDLIHTIYDNIAENGIPESNIPAIDPIAIEKLFFPVVDVLNLTIVDGVFNGISKCKVEKFFTDVEAEHAFMELKCDLCTFKGHYQIVGASPILKSLFGGDGKVHGDGNCKVKIENMLLRFDYDFYIQERDGEFYIKSKQDKENYKYNIGNMHFEVDRLFLGKKDASQLVTKLMNDNWKLLLNGFGKQFMDKAMEFMYVFSQRFFNSVPCKYFISDDLSKYARP